MRRDHWYACVDEHRCDLASIKAHRAAVAPLLMNDPGSVMYQVVVTNVNALIKELECLREYVDNDPARSGESST